SQETPHTRKTVARHMIPFQGHLTVPSKDIPDRYEVVKDGRYDILFTVYTTPAGAQGKEFGPERHENMVVIGGLVNALIGSVDGGLERLSHEVLAGPLYVGITVDADGRPETPDLELVPRQVLLPVMYAHEAGNATLFDGHTWGALESRLKQLER